MSKRATGLGYGKGAKITNHKTKKRLAVKHAMLSARRKAKPQKRKSHQ